MYPQNTWYRFWGQATTDPRDEAVDYVRHWCERTESPSQRLVQWTGVGMSTFYDWRRRYGKLNEHNAVVPRDHWLAAWEREAILRFSTEHPLDGYHRLRYMMMDADEVAVSPATAYRVLAAAGSFARWNSTENAKGTGVEQPLQPNEPGHIDISCVKVCGTSYSIW